MATFIQGVTDTNLDPVLFTPDYSFLRYTIGKKNAQYEQGLKQVSSAYGNLKKELSDPVNTERRDNYLKAAESQLQQIASADLSLQQNVNAANAIFDPIATDKAIGFDSYYTEKNRRERAEMEAWAESDDMATRKKFNKEIYDWLGRDLDSIKNGKGDINNYKVQGRKAWAWVDGQDIINQAAKDQGFEVKEDNLGHPYIVNTTGGKTFAPNYKAFATNVLESNPVYQRQKAILGQARAEGIIDYYRSKPEFAGLTNQQILTSFANSEYEVARDNQKVFLDGLNSELSQKTAEWKAAKEKYTQAVLDNPDGPEAKALEAEAASLQEFKNKIDGLQSKFIGDYGTDKTSFEAKRDKFVQGFVAEPEKYYANKIQVEDVIRFSNMRSAFENRSIKPDQAYLSLLNIENNARRTLNDIIDDRFDNEVSAAKLGQKQQEIDLKRATAAAKLVGKNAKGERLTNADGSEVTSNINFVDYSNTAINTTTTVDQLKDRLALAKASAIQNLTGTFGGLYLMEKMGTSPANVGLIRQFFTNKELDPNTVPTKEENAALQAGYQDLWAYAKQNEGANAELLKNLRAGYNSKRSDYSDIDFPALLIAAASSYNAKDNYDMQAYRALHQYQENKATIKRIADGVDAGMNVVLNTIKDKSEFQDILIKEDDGKKVRLMNQDDIFARLRKKTFFQDIDWAKDPEVNFSDEDLRNIAEGYMNGTIQVHYKGQYSDNSLPTFSTEGSVFDYKGKTYYIPFDYAAFPVDSKTLMNRLKRINEKVSIPEFQKALNGTSADASAMYNLKGEFLDDTRVLLSTGSQTNSNIYVDGSNGDYEQAGAGVQEAVRAAMADKKNIAGMLLYTAHPMNAGKQVVEVTFEDKGTEKSKPVWAGKKYYFPINITQGTAPMFKIFAEATENDEYMELSKANKPYLMNLHESSGVKAEIIPDKPGSKTGTVRLYSKYDPTTNKFTDNWIAQDPLPYDLNKISFSEMKNEIYSGFLAPYMQGVIARNKQAKASSTGGANKLRQLEGLITW